MRCLVAVDDQRERDVVAAAARAFQGVEVDSADLEGGKTQLRRRRYDFAFVQLLSGTRSAEQLWEEYRALDPSLPLVALTPTAAVEMRRKDKSRLGVATLLGTPVDAVELFGTVRRLIDRAAPQAEGEPAASTPSSR